MRALDPEVLNAVWAAAKALIPPREDNHPLGCHRPRISDRLCFRGILIRLVTGCSWAAAEQLLDKAVSDTTLRTRRDEWVTAGVFDALATEAVETYDRIYGLDLGETTGRQLSSQSAPRRPGNREKPHRPRNTAEMVPSNRPQRHPPRLGSRRHQPPRQHPLRPHPHRRRPPRPHPRYRKPSTSTEDTTATTSATKQPPRASTTSTAPKDTNPAPPPPKHQPPSGLRWVVERTNPVAVELRATTPPTPTAAPNTG